MSILQKNKIPQGQFLLKQHFSEGCVHVLPSSLTRNSCFTTTGYFSQICSKHQVITLMSGVAIPMLTHSGMHSVLTWPWKLKGVRNAQHVGM